MFHRNGDKPIIDLCFQREFLALHELGHAWERFNLDDEARDRFRELVGSPPWRKSDIAHNRQGVEIAANTLAHGLLSEPVQPGQHRDREFARFEVLTGSQSPRLAEIPPRDLEAPAPLVRFNTPLKMLRLAHCSSVTARSDVV